MSNRLPIDLLAGDLAAFLKGKARHGLRVGPVRGGGDGQSDVRQLTAGCVAGLLLLAPERRRDKTLAHRWDSDRMDETEAASRYVETVLDAPVILVRGLARATPPPGVRAFGEAVRIEQVLAALPRTPVRNSAAPAIRAPSRQVTANSAFRASVR